MAAMVQSIQEASGFRTGENGYVPLKRPPPEPRKGPSAEEEIQAYLRYLVAEQCSVDAVGRAICNGSIREGYKCYLEQARTFDMVPTTQTWVDAPASQEYRERELAFCRTMLRKVRRVRPNRCKGCGAGPFNDTFKHEEVPTGLL